MKKLSKNARVAVIGIICLFILMAFVEARAKQVYVNHTDQETGEYTTCVTSCVGSVCTVTCF
jgi:hypothetical protein